MTCAYWEASCAFVAGRNIPAVDGLVVGSTFVVAVVEDSMSPGVVEEGIAGSLENHHSLKLERHRLIEKDTMVVGRLLVYQRRYGCLDSPTW